MPVPPVTDRIFATEVLPATVRMAPGLVVPMPTLPPNVAALENVLVPVVDVALIVPNVPVRAVSIEPVVRVVVAPELVKKFVGLPV
jgi:hypothetical protein